MLGHYHTARPVFSFIDLRPASVLTVPPPSPPSLGCWWLCSTLSDLQSQTKIFSHLLLFLLGFFLLLSCLVTLYLSLRQSQSVFVQ